ncbi:MAG: hypothetical protein WC044_09075 [Crocinitomicaceae bacterium]
MNNSEFIRLSLEKRLEILREEGEFIGARTIPSHRVYLYAVHSFFVELYVLSSLNQIQWIEIQSNKQILAEYTQDIDLKGLFE